MLQRKKIQLAWCLYDWANSVYSLTIATAIFPAYYTYVMKQLSDKSGFLNFGFFRIEYVALYSYLISISFIVVITINLFFAGIVQDLQLNKFFMRLFCYSGSLGCVLLFFFDKDHFYFGIIGFAFATLGYAGSLTYYNAFLPLIAKPSEQDKISAKGYAMGYIGSVIMLILNIGLLSFSDKLSISKEYATRISFLMVGFWWFIFSQYTFTYLPRDRFRKRNLKKETLKKGIDELLKALKEIYKYETIKRFLIAFFFYSTGFQVIMYLSSLFATEEIGIKTENLILIILTIQIIAVLGAYFLSLISHFFGNIFTLLCCIFFTIFICVGAYFTYSEFDFVFLAIAVGLMMGGMQSLSRSTFSKMLVQGQVQTLFFSIYEFLEKISIVTGTFLYGLCYQLTGSMRKCILILIFFFVISFIILRTEKNQRKTLN
jgi:UMF1 family MFS transporter